jgi:hypothetical protein
MKFCTQSYLINISVEFEDENYWIEISLSYSKKCDYFLWFLYYGEFCGEVESSVIPLFQNVHQSFNIAVGRESSCSSFKFCAENKNVFEELNRQFVDLEILYLLA